MPQHYEADLPGSSAWMRVNQGGQMSEQFGRSSPEHCGQHLGKRAWTSGAPTRKQRTCSEARLMPYESALAATDGGDTTATTAACACLSRLTRSRGQAPNREANKAPARSGEGHPNIRPDKVNRTNELWSCFWLWSCCVIKPQNTAANASGRRRARTPYGARWRDWQAESPKRRRLPLRAGAQRRSWPGTWWLHNHLGRHPRWPRLRDRSGAGYGACWGEESSAQGPVSSGG